jgi:hypothetical protein
LLVSSLSKSNPGANARGRSAASPSSRPARADRCRSRRDCRPTRRGRHREHSNARRRRARPRRQGSCGCRRAHGALVHRSPSFKPAALADCSTIRSPLFGCTVVSRSPWKTMVGTDGPPSAILDPPPCRMATNAEGRSLAAPQARPEWIPTAAYRSGWVAAMMAAAAPPAGLFQG